MVDDSLQDRLYAERQAEIAEFVFDDRVAAVFPDMIRRSVPGYTTIINMIGTLAEQQVVADSNCYDLGCSLGAAALAIRRGVGERPCYIIAVDNSQAMLRRARQYLEPGLGAPIALVCADIQDMLRFSNVCPGTQQYGIRAYFHCTFSVGKRKLLELKCRSQINYCFR